MSARCNSLPSIAALVLLVSVCPAAARAETVVLLDATDGELGDGRARAEHALTQALAADGVRIVTQQQAESRVGGAADSCTGPECTAELVRGVGADAAIALSIWQTSDPAIPGKLLVTLIDRAGRSFPGRSALAAGDLERGAREALFDARSLQLLGPGPWLHVGSTPGGAQVLLDGRPLGATPTRAVVAPGRHTLEIRLEGLRPHAQTVDIPANAMRQIDVEIDLAPRVHSQTRPAAAPTRERARAAARPRPAPPAAAARPLVGPLLLGGLGVALASYDLALVASDLCQRRDTMGVCTNRSSIDGTPAAVLGALGLAAMASGLLWYLLGEPPETAPAVAISGRGISVRARF